MSKCKALARKAKAETNRLVVELSTGTLSLTRTDRILFIAMAMMTILFFAASTVFGAGDFFGHVKDEIWTYYTKFFGLATVTAVLSITVGVLWIMISPSSKSSATPIAWIKKVLVCYILLMVLGGIFSVIADITKGQGPDTIPH